MGNEGPILGKDLPGAEEMREQVDFLESKNLSRQLESIRAEMAANFEEMKTGKKPIEDVGPMNEALLEKAKKIHGQLARIHAKYQE